MVYYLSASGDGIDRYAETDQGVMDMPQEGYWRNIEYAQPDKVHPSALRENVAADEQGYWVKPETMPKQYLWANGSKPLPDVLPGMVVCDRFRGLVEQFEPGVHQFVPVEIYKSKKGDPVATYYWFIVGQRLDSVDRERTTFMWKAPADDPAAGYWSDRHFDPQTSRMVQMDNAKLIFSNTQVSNHQIWNDPHVMGGERLCSDAFAEALKASGMLGVAATPRASV
jgi:hypothetical protein